MCASAVRTTAAAAAGEEEEEEEEGEIVLNFATKLMHDAVFIKANARREERRRDFEMKTEISTQHCNSSSSSSREIESARGRIRHRRLLLLDLIKSRLLCKRRRRRRRRRQGIRLISMRNSSFQTLSLSFSNSIQLKY